MITIFSYFIRLPIARIIELHVYLMWKNDADGRVNMLVHDDRQQTMNITELGQ